MMTGSIPRQALNPTPGDLIELAKDPEKYDALRKELQKLTDDAQLALAKLQIGDATQFALDEAQKSLAAADEKAKQIVAQAEADAAKIISKAESDAESRENALVAAQNQLDAQKSKFQEQRMATERSQANRSRNLEEREADLASKTAQTQENLEKSQRMLAAANDARNDLGAIAERIAGAAK